MAVVSAEDPGGKEDDTKDFVDVDLESKPGPQREEEAQATGSEGRTS